MSIKIYKVGGAVRDGLLGLTPKDIDYAVEAPSWDAMRQYILGLGGKIYLEKPEYFTMRAKVPDIGDADFVLCRKDGIYKDGRHPETVEVGTIFDDLARRDFTINAMAKDIQTGELIDPFLGRQDLNSRMLRFVGDADKRLTEDRLRAFRAARFAITKRCMLHTETYQAVRKLGPGMFCTVSTERIQEELTKMFWFDSYDTFHHLFEKFPNLGEVVRQRGIWFKPMVAK